MFKVFKVSMSLSVSHIFLIVVFNIRSVINLRVPYFLIERCNLEEAQSSNGQFLPQLLRLPPFRENLSSWAYGKTSFHLCAGRQ